MRVSTDMLGQRTDRHYFYVRYFARIELEGQKHYVTDLPGIPRTTRVGGCVARSGHCGDRGMLGSHELGRHLYISYERA